ncbi:uncharacterized protein BXZ73DRAFT_37376 [Epithele typhae]|uniref:uncharacterized protein n=1 Tax=Epithele typhae TaxID=378194 RepID=UPI002008D8C9|nr:uncharacterized protein BXZ73DRAFT_37376 [Epithele typhae]KAH9946128.1 hypothetical protein BXZ73DRAFT_37376 [Epithele typhae]
MPASTAHSTLHIWPPYGDLLSIDISSVAALLYLQLTIPGSFSVVHCANPDVSPTGQLPFLTHGLHQASGFSSIAAFVRNLPHARHLDTHLTSVEAAQITARVAHIESDYGDLVNHMLYSLQENWAAVTGPALVSMLPLPQRYYVPSRVRLSHQARLETVELWHVPEVEEDEDEPRKVFGRRKKVRPATEPQRFKAMMEREKVVEKTCAVLEVYDRLLGRHAFFMGSDSPTTLDIAFAAHSHMLLNARYPDPLVTDVLTEKHPRLVAHCNRVIETASTNFVPQVIEQRWTSSLWYLFPSPRMPARRRAPSVSVEAQKEDWRYKLWRWGFMGTSVLVAAVYVTSVFQVRLISAGDVTGREDVDELEEVEAAVDED